jgi:Glucose-6-phosphate dehydrogenase, NAD binding domain
MIKRLVIFGATGDLTARYLLPGIVALHDAGLLPEGLPIAITLIFSAPGRFLTISRSAGFTRGTHAAVRSDRANVIPARYRVPIDPRRTGKAVRAVKVTQAYRFALDPTPGPGAGTALPCGRGPVRLELGAGQVPGAVRGRAQVVFRRGAAQAVEPGEEVGSRAWLVGAEFEVRVSGVLP